MEPTYPCASPDARSSRTGGARLGRRAPRGMAQRGLRRMESSPCNRVRRRVEKRDFRVSQATGKRRLIISYSYVRLKSHTRRILRSVRPTLKLIGKFNPSIDRRTSKFPPAAFDFLQDPISPSHPVFSHKLSDEIRSGRCQPRAQSRALARDAPPAVPTDRRPHRPDARSARRHRRETDARRAESTMAPGALRFQETRKHATAPKTERSDAAGFERRVRALRPANPRPLERRR